MKINKKRQYQGGTRYCLKKNKTWREKNEKSDG
jgi:hypothetical protein